jgi:uncharacterized protein (TIGR03546 family)
MCFAALRGAGFGGTPMAVLKLLFNLVKVLNSETSAAAIAAALAIGMGMGLIPILSLQWALLALVLLFFRVNLTVALVAFGLCKLAAIGLNGPLDALGTSLLENEGLRGLWTAFFHTPALWLFQTHNSVVLGSTVAALALAGPVFLLADFLVRLYRQNLEERLATSRVAMAFNALRIVQLYRRFVSPLG